MTIEYGDEVDCSMLLQRLKQLADKRDNRFALWIAIEDSPDLKTRGLC